MQNCLAELLPALWFLCCAELAIAAGFHQEPPVWLWAARWVQRDDAGLKETGSALR